MGLNLNQYNLKVKFEYLPDNQRINTKYSFDDIFKNNEDIFFWIIMTLYFFNLHYFHYNKISLNRFPVKT